MALGTPRPPSLLCIGAGRIVNLLDIVPTEEAKMRELLSGEPSKAGDARRPRTVPEREDLGQAILKPSSPP
jgi:hypothetical protein